MSKDLWQKAKELDVSPTERWEWYIKHQYSLTIKQHNEMIEAQKGLCAICKLKRKLHIDHDHATGKVRGLLCKSCNYKLLGMIEKNIKLVEMAISYLKKWRKS